MEHFFSHREQHAQCSPLCVSEAGKHFLMIRFKMIITLTMHVTVNVNNRLKEEIFLGQSRCCAIAILT